MPAPDRVPPIKIMPDATRFPKGIVDHYSAAEVDALLAGLPSGVQSGVHEGPIPQPSVPTPQALEDAFVDFEDGLHYFKDAGSLVAITRQDYQTTITITGPAKSVAKIVKSEAGLPTPQNPSYLVQQEPDGKWMKLTSDEINTPFGPPQMVDLFALTGGGADLTNYYNKPEVDAKLALKADTTNPNQIIRANKFESEQLFVGQIDFVPADWRIAVARDEKLERQLILQKGPVGTPVDYIAVKADLLAHYTKPEVDAKVALKADRADLLESIVAELSREPSALSNWMRVIVTSPDFTNGVRGIDHQHTMQDIPGLYSSIEGIGWKLDDRYTKKEVDDKIEADKDFSIANDNVLLASITSLQEIVANLGSVGTGQIDTLTAIKGVEIEPLSVKFTESTASPIQWKGGLSLVPTKVGDDYQLTWNDGKNVSALVTSADLTAEGLASAIAGQDLTQGTIQASVFSIGGLYLGSNGDRLVTQVDGGDTNEVAYKSDLSGYAEKPVVTLMQNQMQVLFDSIYTREEADARYAKAQDKEQAILTKTVVSQAYGFGDTNLPPVALSYTDTGEGYGPRLVFSKGMENDYVALRSDFEEVNTRMTAIEAAQGLATGKLNIEDPVFAELKKSILDAVAKQAVGDDRYAPPDDINWTGLRTGMFIQMMSGFIELKGVVPITKTSSGFTLATIPDRFPLPNADASYPVACREVGVAVRYGYITVSATSRDITFSPGGAINELTVNGIRFKAKWN